MSKKKVTESPEELIGKANSDVIAIIGIIKNDELFTVDDRETVGVHAQQMAEKLLKAYLLNNEKTKNDVFHGHNLKIYFNQAILLDKSFENIEKNIVQLNNYTAEARYVGKIVIDDKDFEGLLNDIKTVYYFPAFIELINTFDKSKTRGIIDNKHFDEIIEKYRRNME